MRPAPWRKLSSIAPHTFKPFPARAGPEGKQRTPELVSAPYLIVYRLKFDGAEIAGPYTLQEAVT